MLYKKSLKLNLHYSITKQMLKSVKETDSDKFGETKEDLARLMIQMSLIISVLSIEEPTKSTNPEVVKMYLRRECPVS